jgi:adenine nucleotide transporter 17
MSVVLDELHNEGGLLRFWRGIWPALILTCNPAINYATFDSLKAKYIFFRTGKYSENEDTYLDPLPAFVVAALAKTLATIVTYPLIRAKVMKQLLISCKGHFRFDILT